MNVVQLKLIKEIKEIKLRLETLENASKSVVVNEQPTVAVETKKKKKVE